MIHIVASIEPEEGEEFNVVQISFMRRQLEDNDKGESKYTYGGWYKDKEGDKHHFANYIYANRNDNILKIVSDICLNAMENIIE